MTFPMVPDGAYRQLEELLATAERAAQNYLASWKDSESPHLEQFLPNQDAPEYEFVLLSLIDVDRQERTRRGQSLRLEDWLRRFPHANDLIREHWGFLDSPVPVMGEIFGQKHIKHRHETQVLQSLLHDRPRLERFVEGRSSVIYCAQKNLAVAPLSDPSQLAVTPTTAIKLYAQAFFDRMPAECRRPWRENWLKGIQRLQKDNPYGAVTVQDFGPVEDRCFLRLDWVEGGSIARFLKQSDNLVKCIEIVQAAAAALLPAHAAGHFHGGLRASKILLTPSGETHIIGFGSVAAFAGMSIAWRTSQRGMRNLLAPELMSSPDALSPACDVYSLNGLLYRLLTGHLPSGQLDAPEVDAEFPSNKPIPLRRLNPLVPRALESLIEKGLSRDPNRRIASLQSFVDELAAIRDSLSKPSPRRSWWPWRRA